MQSKERNCEYTIDRFMTVDFLDVYDGQTYLNSIGNEAQRLYIARIKIKVGDQRELYHVINKTRHIPEAYQREDKSVKKKDMKEFYELFYRKISGI